MKKFVFILVMMLVVPSFTACDDTGKTNTNVIADAQLTDKEKILLSVGSNKYFAFDFNVDSKYKWVEVWADRYEHGKKVSNIGKLATGLSASKGNMIIAAVEENEKGTSEWTLAINAGGSLSKAETNQEYKVKEDSSIASSMSVNNSKISIGDKEIVLANVCYRVSGEEATFRSLSGEFYDNPEAHMEEIAEYDVVYLLKCKFYDTEQQP